MPTDGILESIADRLEWLDRYPNLRITFRIAQAISSFFQFTIMSGVAAHENSKGSVSFLTGYDIFVGLSSFLASLAIGLIPWLYSNNEHARILKGPARALRIPRVEFILTIFWVALWFLSILITTIVYYTKSECKDPNSPSDELTACRNGKASVAFGWFTFIFLLFSLLLVLRSHYAGQFSSTNDDNAMMVQANIARKPDDNDNEFDSRDHDSLDDAYGDYHSRASHAAIQNTNSSSIPQPHFPPYLQADEDELHSFDAPGYRPSARGYYDQTPAGLVSIGGTTVPVASTPPPNRR